MLIKMQFCLTFIICLVPALTNSLRASLCLASSKLLHMHLPLAGTRFNYYYHRYYYRYYYYFYYYDYYFIVKVPVSTLVP